MNGDTAAPESPTAEELIDRFPGELITHDSADHYRGRLARRLLMNRCAECQSWHAPPHPVCPRCWSRQVVAEAVRGSGTIYLLTFLHQGSAAPGVAYDPPYPVVSVELDEQPGLRFTSTVVDADLADIVIGARVTLSWRTFDRAPMPVFVLSDTPR
ncbi:MAG: hypothetical protein QOG79_1705 [Mycobacterium sp.]|nr:hypothetical protein [Mycobacterium sp.]